MKKIFIGLICVFALSLFFSHKSYAIVDRVVNITENLQYQLCDGSSGFSCSDYNYLIIEVSTVGSATGTDNFGVSGSFGGRSSAFYVPQVGWGSPYTLFSMSGWTNLRTTNGYSLGLALEQGTTYKITLTDTSPIQTPEPCPEPEEPDPCPDPEENSRFIQVVLDAFWKYHMVFAGAVAGLIAIFVVYRIIKGMLR